MCNCGCAYVKVGLYIRQALLRYRRVLYGAHFDGALVEIDAGCGLDAHVRDQHVGNRVLQRYLQRLAAIGGAPLHTLDDQMTVS